MKMMKNGPKPFHGNPKIQIEQFGTDIEPLMHLTSSTFDCGDVGKASLLQTKENDDSDDIAKGGELVMRGMRRMRRSSSFFFKQCDEAGKADKAEANLSESLWKAGASRDGATELSLNATPPSHDSSYTCRPIKRSFIRTPVDIGISDFSALQILDI